MKKTITALFCLLMSSPAHSQMAAASLFSEMKSINPAVVGGRTFGQYTFIGNSDKYEKSQVINESENSKLDSKITGFSAFRGGKKGGFITTEASFILQSGSRSLLIEGGADNFDISSDVTFYQIQVAVAFWNFLGLQFTKQDFELEQKFIFDQGATGDDVIISNENITRDSLGVKIGLSLPLGPLRFSTYYEIMSADQVVISTRPSLPAGSSSPNGRFVGVGVGLLTKAFHFEVAVERFMNPELGLQEEATAPAPEPRNRLTGTIEAKVFGVAVGYTGRLYQEGYRDQDQTVVNQLIYGNSLEDRIEHNVNFSLSKDKGFAFGGSLIYSKVTGEEQSPIEPASLKQNYPTESKQVGFMIKLGYVW